MHLKVRPRDNTAQFIPPHSEIPSIPLDLPIKYLKFLFMDETNSSQNKISLWVIWYAILSGMGILLQFAGGGWPKGETTEEYLTHPVFIIGWILFLVSMGVRWFLLPRLAPLTSILPVAIIGMALSESAFILSLFVLPSSMTEGRQILCLIGFIGVALYLPIYASSRPRSGPRDFTQLR